MILIQENRRFDHYFGTRPGVRGFADPAAAASRQPAYGGTPAPRRHLCPYPPTPGDDCTPDITHDWGAQHASWNGGAMDGFVASTWPRTAPSGP